MMRKRYTYKLLSGMLAAAIAAVPVVPAAAASWSEQPADVYEALEMPFPSTIRLNSNTSFYDEPSLKAHQAGSLSAQEVYVRAVRYTDDQAASRTDTSVWVRITTWLGEKWILAAPEQLAGPEELINEYISLLRQEPLYAAPDAHTATGKALSPQTVYAEAVSGLYYRIRTDDGPRWIKSPGRMAAYRVKPQRMQVTLGTQTPLFARPEADLAPSGQLSPQTITVFEETEDGWLHADTWMGPVWLHPELSLPANIVATDETITLLESKQAYLFPNIKSKLMHHLGASTYHMFERAGQWAHVNYGHYTGWIYLTTPASSYRAPSQVETEQLQADVKEFTYDAGTGWDGYPLAVNVLTLEGSAQFPNPAVEHESFDSGTDLKIKVNLTNISTEDVEIAKPFNLVFEIARIVPDSGDAAAGTTDTPVWRGSVTVQPSEMKSGTAQDKYYAAIYEAVWDQRDSNGTLVPPGDYWVKLKTPVAIPYRDGKGAEQTEQLESSMRTGRIIALSAPR